MGRRVPSDSDMETSPEPEDLPMAVGDGPCPVSLKSLAALAFLGLRR